MKIKGMRDISTFQGLKQRSAPTDRKKAMMELARLEHTKVRLERELEMWVGHQMRTKRQVDQVKERIGLLRQTLIHADPEEEKETLSPAKAQSEPNETKQTAWKEVSLDY